MVVSFNPNDIGSNGVVNTFQSNFGDLYPFIELTVIKRKADEIAVGLNNTISVELGDEGRVISLLGYDQETGNYTTNYSEDIVGVENRNNDSGFGITEINVKVPASLTPTVDITFVDVRGAALMRDNKNSPYNFIYDFPPPIYKLKMKGAYGKAVEFYLHMINKSVSLDTNTGNYIIKMNLISAQFAPLTDILLAYVLFIGADVNPNTNTSEVTSYYDFITKAKRMYTDINATLNNAPEKNSINKLETKVSNLKQVYNSLLDLDESGKRNTEDTLKTKFGDYVESFKGKPTGSASYSDDVYNLSYLDYVFKPDYVNNTYTIAININS